MLSMPIGSIDFKVLIFGFLGVEVHRSVAMHSMPIGILIYKISNLISNLETPDFQAKFQGVLADSAESQVFLNF